MQEVHSLNPLVVSAICDPSNLKHDTIALRFFLLSFPIMKELVNSYNVHKTFRSCLEVFWTSYVRSIYFLCPGGELSPNIGSQTFHACALPFIVTLNTWYERLNFYFLPQTSKVMESKWCLKFLTETYITRPVILVAKNYQGSSLVLEISYIKAYLYFLNAHIYGNR